MVVYCSSRLPASSRPTTTSLSFLTSSKISSENERVRILLELDDFHGWELAAGWEDLKFGLRHYRDLERLAIVGDRTWERVMANVFKPFTVGQVRYFDRSEIAAAREWISDSVGE
jgi:hypothetical protein